MNLPAAAAASYPLGPGLIALPPGFVFIEATRSLIAADAHFAYEDAIDAALPMWSTHEGLAALQAAAASAGAAEIVILGDIVHGARLRAAGAAGVAAGLAALRERFMLTLVAGNHEGRSRAAAVIGPAHDAVERAGWTLVHGDRPQLAGPRSMIGHLHPSIRFGGTASVPAFLAGPRLLVVPALTPYSAGLSVLSNACAGALRRWRTAPEDLDVVAVTADRVYPFGNLAVLGAALKAAG